MAVGAQEWVDPSMSAVCASSALLRTVHLCVPDDQVLNVKSLNLSIGLTVRQKLVYEAYRLLWPSTLGSLLDLVALGLAWDTIIVAAVGDHAFMVKNIL
jgi:hypothetical protein